MTLKTWFILVPCVVIGVVVTVANLTPVQFSLDPFSDAYPALAVTVPLYVVILAAFFAGLLAGGLGAWLGQSGIRRDRRAARRELKRLHASSAEAAAADKERAPGTALAPAEPTPASVARA